MEKIELSKCTIKCHYGREMHTHKVNFSYKATWIYVDCDESSIQDNNVYKVWLVTKNSDNLDDLSSETTVYHFESVPADIIKKKEEVDAYWSSKEPSKI